MPTQIDQTYNGSIGENYTTTLDNVKIGRDLNIGSGSSGSGGGSEPPSHGNEVAKYFIKPVDHHQSLLTFSRLPIAGISISTLIFFTGYLSDLSTILSNAGLPSGAFTQAFIYVAAMFMIFLSFIRLSIIIDLINPRNVWSRRYGTVYEKSDDGSIGEGIIYGECPVHGCSGKLRIARVGNNYEGVHSAAICSSHDIQHAFEFNDSSYEGLRIRITPKPIENQT